MGEGRSLLSINKAFAVHLARQANPHGNSQERGHDRADGYPFTLFTRACQTDDATGVQDVHTG